MVQRTDVREPEAHPAAVPRRALPTSSVAGGTYERAAVILVVGDVEEIRDGIEQLLSVDGYHVEPARNEDEAVDKASCQSPDLMLLSLDGDPDDIVATGVRIRERADLDVTVPIVVFCVPIVDEGAEIRVGDNVYVTRPDNFDQLRGFIRRLLWAAALLGLGGS